MSEYQKKVRKEATSFFETNIAFFEKDEGDHGGKSSAPNLMKWIDETGKLKEYIDGLAKDWGRGEVEMIQSNSRNKVTYGDPRESAFFAFFKDLQHEIKKLKKTRTS